MRIDPFRSCSLDHILNLKNKLKSMPSGYFDVTTRVLGIIVNDTIDREIKLNNNKNLKFDLIRPGVYRVREVLNTDGNYGWQFISPQTGSIMCGHNREDLLDKHIGKINIMSETSV